MYTGQNNRARAGGDGRAVLRQPDLAVCEQQRVIIRRVGNQTAQGLIVRRRRQINRIDPVRGGGEHPFEIGPQRRAGREKKLHRLFTSNS